MSRTQPDPAIREYIAYDPETGVFTWLKRPFAHSRQQAGDVAGILRPTGYRQIKFRKRLYLAHRLAWWFVHGEWPLRQIDHRNCRKDDNRIDNLRPATGTQNQGNCGPQERNKSGFKGVHFNKRRRVWIAAIGIKSKVHYLGRFSTPEEAAHAYDEAALKHFGAFAWLNFPERRAA
jgi:hypothetical protein